MTKFIKKIPAQTSNRSLLEKAIVGVINIKNKSIFSRIRPYIKGEKILDVGVGSGGLSKFLKDKKYDVQGIDIADKSFFSDVTPVVYDGETFDFKDGQFDTSLIIHVLHHCTDGYKVLSEAMRVSKRVIFIEDTYRNKIEHFIVSLNDSLANFELYPHTYRTPKTWRNHIKKSGWKIVHEESYSEFLYGYIYGRYVMFVIEK